MRGFDSFTCYSNERGTKVVPKLFEYARDVHGLLRRGNLERNDAEEVTSTLIFDRSVLRKKAQLVGTFHFGLNS